MSETNKLFQIKRITSKTPRTRPEKKRYISRVVPGGVTGLCPGITLSRLRPRDSRMPSPRSLIDPQPLSATRGPSLSVRSYGDSWRPVRAAHCVSHSEPRENLSQPRKGQRPSKSSQASADPSYSTRRWSICKRVKRPPLVEPRIAKQSLENLDFHLGQRENRPVRASPESGRRATKVPVVGQGR